MESWIRNIIKNLEIVDLILFDSNNEITSKPCLSYNIKGLIYLIPLRIFDIQLTRLKPSTKCSILFSNNGRLEFPQILLEGEVINDDSNVVWESMKNEWLLKDIHLSELFDIKELFLPQQNRRTLLKFKPYHLMAWEDIDVDPVNIEMEIV